MSQPASLVANNPEEEEKKVVAALLGKLYISPASNEDKIRDAYAEVSEAVETNLISDTTGRNALYKIHVSLGKIVNGLDQQQEAGQRRSTASRSVSLAPEEAANRASAAAAAAEDRTVVQEPQIKEEDEEEEEEESRAGDDDSNGTVVHTKSELAATENDSLVSDLLDDDGDTVMQ